MRYSNKNSIDWCSKNKNGLSIIESNGNLAKAYIIKAEESLKSMKENVTHDWKISMSYYAIYFSLYAILCKIGIKSEIHLCTIEFARNFLKDYYSEEEIFFIKRSLSARINAQYYVNRAISIVQSKEIQIRAPEFIAKAKDTLINLNEIRRNEIMKDYKNYCSS